MATVCGAAACCGGWGCCGSWFCHTIRVGCWRPVDRTGPDLLVTRNDLLAVPVDLPGIPAADNTTELLEVVDPLLNSVAVVASASLPSSSSPTSRGSPPTSPELVELPAVPLPPATTPTLSPSRSTFFYFIPSIFVFFRYFLACQP